MKNIDAEGMQQFLLARNRGISFFFLVGNEEITIFEGNDWMQLFYLEQSWGFFGQLVP